MSIDAKEPQKSVQYIDASGRFTTPGMLLIIALVKELQAQEARITALENP